MTQKPDSELANDGVPDGAIPVSSFTGLGGPSLKALDKQIGGGHYKTLAIQPIEFIIKNKLGFCEGNVIKYICRYRLKGGTEDLEKAKHYIDLLLEERTK